MERIYVVASELKDAYEYALIQRTDLKALLFDSVLTFDQFYERALNENRQYKRKKITRVDKVKVIYELIDGYKSFSKDQYSLVIDFINTMQDEKANINPDLSHVLPYTKVKLEECIDLYNKYMKYLEEHSLYDRIYEPYVFDCEVVLVDDGSLTKSQKQYLDLYHPTYFKHDLYNSNKVLVEALNKQEEISYVLHDISLKLQNNEYNIEDIGIYVSSEDLLMLNKMAKGYNLVLNTNIPLYDKYYLFFSYMQKYLLDHNHQWLLNMYALYRHKESIFDFMTSFIEYANIDNTFITRKVDSIIHSDDQVTNLIEFFKQCMNNYEDVHYVEVCKFIEQFKDLPLYDFLLLVVKEFPKASNDVNIKNGIDIIPLYKVNPNKKLVYIIGCNEEKMPQLVKDKGILLTADLELLGCTLPIDKMNEHTRLLNHMIQCYPNIVFTYPNSSLKGDSLLLSSYVMKLACDKKKVEPYKEVISRRYEHQLLLHSDDEVYNDIHTMLNDTTKQPVNVVCEDEKHMSVTRLENYNGCPFKYFMTYMMKAKPLQRKKNRANDYGTIMHDMVDYLNGYIKGEMDEVAIDDYIHAFVLPEDELEAYFVSNTLKHTKNILKVLRYQYSKGKYILDSTEQKLVKNRNDYVLEGRFDRLDIYEGKAKIIDYKSSDKDIQLDLAKLGFNIQMLVYLDMLSLQQGATLYFSMARKVLKKDDVEEVKAEDFYELYRHKGLIIDDEENIKALETIDRKGIVIPVTYVKKSNSYKGSLISKEDLDQLLESIYARIDEMVNNIYEKGIIDIMPAYSKNQTIHTKVNPCKYCDYKCVCLKDVFYHQGREIGGEEDGESI